MRTERLFHHCFYGHQIEDKDLFPVGGGIIGSVYMPWMVCADFSEFFPKFQKATEPLLDHYQNDEWQSWFAENIPTVDPKLATILQVFTTTFEAKRKMQMQSTDDFARKQMYDKAINKTRFLSDVFSSNTAMCVEQSLLAHQFLKMNGVDSFVYSGEMMSSFKTGDIHLPFPHTFLLINYNKKEWVFDPANPNTSTDGRDFSALLSPCISLVSSPEVKKDVLLIESEDARTHKKRYYGVGDCGNIPESLIVFNQTPKRFDPVVVKQESRLQP